MTDYRTLSDEDKKQVLKELDNPSNYIWELKILVVDFILEGYYCAKCWRVYYNCVCSHNN